MRLLNKTTLLRTEKRLKQNDYIDFFVLKYPQHTFSFLWKENKLKLSIFPISETTETKNLKKTVTCRLQETLYEVKHILKKY